MNGLIQILTESGIVIDMIMGLGLVCLGLLFFEDERSKK